MNKSPMTRLATKMRNFVEVCWKLEFHDVMKKSIAADYHCPLAKHFFVTDTYVYVPRVEIRSLRKVTFC